MATRFRFLACMTALGITLSACGAPVQGQGQGEGDGDTVVVVASTDVYGSLVEAVGGQAVEVTSIISGASQDPHSYEATVRDKLAVSEADLVLLNGGGYDPFMQQLTDSVAVPGERIISAVGVSGLDDVDAHGHDGGGDEDGAHEHEHGSFNEHVWYDLQAMQELVSEIAGSLSDIEPSQAADFEANARDLLSSLQELEAELSAASDATDEAGVAMTEPVPLYLLEHAGLENRTPPAFTEAVEEGADVSLAAMRQMKELIRSGDVAFLAYNPQTQSPQTQAVRESAEQAGVPVVNFTETLPEGQDYLEWMKQNVEAVITVVEH